MANTALLLVRSVQKWISKQFVNDVVENRVL